MSKQKNERIKVASNSFDVIDVGGGIGIRFADQISHISVEHRRYKDGEKKCDRREGILAVFPKSMLPEVIDNLARLALIETGPCSIPFQQDTKRISTWKTRIQNTHDRVDLISLLRLVAEVGDQEDLAPLINGLGEFIRKNAEKNPHIAEKYMHVTEELFPEMLAMADAMLLMDMEAQGHA